MLNLLSTRPPLDLIELADTSGFRLPKSLRTSCTTWPSLPVPPRDPVSLHVPRTRGQYRKLMELARMCVCRAGTGRRRRAAASYVYGVVCVRTLFKAEVVGIDV